MDPRESSATYNDIIAVAGAQLTKMYQAGHFSERWLHQLLAQLNATLYTLGFAMPPGTIQVENTDTGIIREVVNAEKAPQVATPKRKTKA